MSYHLKKIDRAVYGSPHKIVEETEEFIDSIEQNCILMAWIELSDLLGAGKVYFHRFVLSNPALTFESKLVG